MVEYKLLVEFPGYRVGNDGSVWSCRTNKPGILRDWRKLKPGRVTKKRRRGNVVTALLMRFPTKGKPAYRQVHHLVLEAFIGPRPEGMEGCHNDNDPTNNAVGNLRWDTRPGNYSDRFAFGTENNGSKNGRAKMTEADVTEIRRLYAGGETQVRLGRRFGVEQATISSIILRKTWSHVA